MEEVVVSGLLETSWPKGLGWSRSEQLGVESIGGGWDGVNWRGWEQSRLEGLGAKSVGGVGGWSWSVCQPKSWRYYNVIMPYIMCISTEAMTMIMCEIFAICHVCLSTETMAIWDNASLEGVASSCKMCVDFVKIMCVDHFDN